MREVSELPKAAQAILNFAGKRHIPMHFNPVTMDGLSIPEFEEVETHLKALPTSKAVSETLEAIDSARQAGMGPWKETLLPLKLPERVETLVYVASHRAMQFDSPHNIHAMKSLNPEEVALFHEGLKRSRLELKATGNYQFDGELLEKNIKIATEQTAPKVAIAEKAASAGYYSSSSVTTQTAKAEESWMARLSKEKWVGKKGLAVTGAVIGVGAILYGAKKFFDRDKSSENQPAR